jgi:8-oxo-dGTP pyrophosphatase MutT (NUDIX family)
MWDGTPVAEEPPFGAMVVVFRRRRSRTELLVLHRRAAGPAGFDGDWAWTPPSGARRPQEAIASCATRELAEETGLKLPCVRVDGGGDWAIFVAEAPPDTIVTLDDEHDGSRWLPPVEALAACRPATVADAVREAIVAIERTTDP